jgi:exopolysaccharide biosynthesis polyprenyl glycosylphosphotransferase
LLLVDLLLVPVGLLAASQLRTLLPFGRGGALSEAAVSVPWYVYLTAVCAWGACLISTGSYNPRLSLRWFNEAWRVVWGATLASGLMAGVLYFGYRELSRLQFVYFSFASVLLLLGYRAGIRIVYRLRGKARPGTRSKVLIVGAGELGERVAKVLLDHSRWGYDLVGFLDDDPSKLGSELAGLSVLGTIDGLNRVVEERGVEEVWVALPVRAYDRLQGVVTALERQAMRIKVVPDYFSLALVRPNAEILGGMPIIGLRDPLIEGGPRVVKRLFDLVMSALLLIPGLVVMGVIALLIRLDSKGSVLLRQERVGENGRAFKMHKFRTMVAGAEQELLRSAEAKLEELGPHKQRADLRVTRIGRILRHYSLDELPQLLNVLKGDMSLVGPRPELPWLVQKYEAWQRKRFAVPQGLTGWWQINGRSDKPMHLHTEDDLYYVYNYSLWLDLWILLRTPIAVLRGKGAF